MAAARKRARLAAKRRAEAGPPIEILPPSAAAEEEPAPASGSKVGLVPAQASTKSRSAAVPIVLAGLGALAIALLAMALIPDYLARWYWVENLLAGRRQQFAISGVMSLVAAGIFFAFIFLSG